MAKYIDREVFIAQKRELYCGDCDRRKGMKKGKMRFLYEIGDAPCRACGIEDILSDVEDFPTADVQPVKHAAWDYAMPVDGPERNRYRCSRCSGFALLDFWGRDVRSRYCPECGAVMDDEGKKYWVHYDGKLTPAED